ncbi:hypothetical protein C8263_14120 [Deinococcus arcticus]|uniref:Uncharacterized protein n=1 Tax=Deinococcus arcticus TaxID=2136176 RepID=A0A2T3W5P7_9DEIO|nr:hypothetical protein C8263_14120 [Deinococcus arcticus]
MPEVMQAITPAVMRLTEQVGQLCICPLLRGDRVDVRRDGDGGEKRLEAVGGNRRCFCFGHAHNSLF